jgi:hypothetical protein
MLIPRKNELAGVQEKRVCLSTGIPSDEHATGHTGEEVQRDTEVAGSQQLTVIGMKVRP